MIRSIIGSEPAVLDVAHRPRGGRFGHRVRTAPQCARRRPSRVHAAVRGSSDRGPGALRQRGRTADHRSAGGRPAERRRGRRRYPLGVGCGAFGCRDGVQTRNRHLPGTADGARAAHTSACVAAGVATAHDDQSYVVVQPDHDDRYRPEQAVDDRGGSTLQLGDQAALDGCAWRIERFHLGPARPAASGAGRPGAACGSRGHAKPGRRDDGQRAIGVAAYVPRGLDARYRRFHRNAQSEAPGPPRFRELRECRKPSAT